MERKFGSFVLKVCNIWLRKWWDKDMIYIQNDPNGSNVALLPFHRIFHKVILLPIIIECRKT